LTRRLAQQKVRTVKNVGQTPYGRPQDKPPATPEPEPAEEIELNADQKVLAQLMVAWVLTIGSLAVLAWCAGIALTGGGLLAMGAWWWAGTLLELLWFTGCVKTIKQYFEELFKALGDGE